MKRYDYKIDGEPVAINRVETDEDLEEFRDFTTSRKVLACDSETTGLDMYSADFRVRLVQFGDLHTSYVLPVELGGRFVEAARATLLGADKLVFQNGMFDLQVFDRHLGVTMEQLWPKVLDTKILAHLVDSRGQGEGGVGNSLESLTRHYVSEDVADNVKGLMGELAKSHKERTGVKATKNTIWSLIELDHPQYNLYAGMDTILAARLANILTPLVPASARSLVPFEHKVAEVCSYMERTGFLLDAEYAESLSSYLAEREANYCEVASTFGIEKVNSTEQVADALESYGVVIKGRTESGKRQVDKTLLAELLTHEGGKARAIAEAVTEAKKARKWRTTWVDGFLANMDADGRCHANINSLRARTARMSITGIPAQTLPSSDWMIRRCFIADEGHRIASVDYQNQELRVLAVLAGEDKMIEAFKRGVSIHEVTAGALGVPKKVGKMANFLKVFGGGPAALEKQGGIPYPQARKALQDFDRAYPKVKAYQDKVQQEVESNGYVTTQSGRRLYVDTDRSYSGLNYKIQSSARDVTCRGIVRLYEAGATDFLRLPIHDENVLSLPDDQPGKAEYLASKVGRLMSEQMGPLTIGTDPEVGGRSWGSLYFKDEDGALIGRDPELKDIG